MVSLYESMIGLCAGLQGHLQRKGSDGSAFSVPWCLNDKFWSKLAAWKCLEKIRLKTCRLMNCIPSQCGFPVALPRLDVVLEGVNQALHQNGGTLLEFIGDEAGSVDDKVVVQRCNSRCI